jgi:hypothetical protein
VDRASHLSRERQVERRRVEAEQPVRHPVGKRGVGLLPLPRRRKLGERLAVAVDLRVLRRRRVGHAVGAREEAVEIVEAAVLGVDHDDVLHAVEARVLRRLHRARGEQGRERGNRQSPKLHVSATSVVTAPARSCRAVTPMD